MSYQCVLQVPDTSTHNFQITVEQAAINHVQALYIKPGHPIFNLVPPNLGNYIQHCYE
jgi:hypothetical protein